MLNTRLKESYKELDKMNRDAVVGVSISDITKIDLKMMDGVKNRQGSYTIIQKSLEDTADISFVRSVVIDTQQLSTFSFIFQSSEKTRAFILESTKELYYLFEERTRRDISAIIIMKKEEKEKKSLEELTSSLSLEEKKEGSDKEVVEMKKKKLKLYTDGACPGNQFGGYGGWGFIIVDEDDKLVIQRSGSMGLSTNNRAEVTALIEGFHSAAVRKDTISQLDVYTDSQYCIGMLTLGWKAKENIELIAQLKKEYYVLIEKIPVYIHKVAGHSGDKYNTIADQLAVAAAKKRE